MAGAVIVSALSRDGVDPFVGLLRAEGMGSALEDGWWFGVRDDGSVVGVARVQERAGFFILDDVYVLPEHRKRGGATSLVTAARAFAGTRAASEIWLLSDEDMIGFYRERGFVAVEPATFPPPLAELSASKGEWPAAGDHVHTAMRSPVHC
ncbi:MAG: GNAT family N-acetyltransferase [Actinobacteria bacterium]|nr:GNAT family N-acetyltransferase [Actinomycetota bacterium]